ncbi:hypothetical protein CLIB1423_01S00650 [[Candida] railenensis]|uniref:Uncharacterized protein n=1 Tax=[Candida] railenensis TaxID=45579 RepID=A0A9P0VW03_9ASCO|nr:hypothetical protein CLIB1423_01S00650 [[Candida] railenensis]
MLNQIVLMEIARAMNSLGYLFGNSIFDIRKGTKIEQEVLDAIKSDQDLQSQTFIYYVLDVTGNSESFEGSSNPTDHADTCELGLCNKSNVCELELWYRLKAFERNSDATTQTESCESELRCNSESLEGNSDATTQTETCESELCSNSGSSEGSSEATTQPVTCQLPPQRRPNQTKATFRLDKDTLKRIAYTMESLGYYFGNDITDIRQRTTKEQYDVQCRVTPQKRPHQIKTTFRLDDDTLRRIALSMNSLGYYFGDDITDIKKRREQDEGKAIELKEAEESLEGNSDANTQTETYEPELCCNLESLEGNLDATTQTETCESGLCCNLESLEGNSDATTQPVTCQLPPQRRPDQIKATFRLDKDTLKRIAHTMESLGYYFGNDITDIRQRTTKEQYDVQCRVTPQKRPHQIKTTFRLDDDTLRRIALSMNSLGYYFGDDITDIKKRREQDEGKAIELKALEELIRWKPGKQICKCTALFLDLRNYYSNSYDTDTSNSPMELISNKHFENSEEISSGATTNSDTSGMDLEFSSDDTGCTDNADFEVIDTSKLLDKSFDKGQLESWSSSESLDKDFHWPSELPNPRAPRHTFRSKWGRMCSAELSDYEEEFHEEYEDENKFRRFDNNFGTIGFGIYTIYEEEEKEEGEEDEEEEEEDEEETRERKERENNYNWYDYNYDDDDDDDEKEERYERDEREKEILAAKLERIFSDYNLEDDSLEMMESGLAGPLGGNNLDSAENDNSQSEYLSDAILFDPGCLDKLKIVSAKWKVS